jgi:hypothetical protein
MQRMGAWIEPVLVAEWARMIRDYGEKMGTVGQAKLRISLSGLSLIEIPRSPDSKHNGYSPPERPCGVSGPAPAFGWGASTSTTVYRGQRGRVVIFGT